MPVINMGYRDLEELVGYGADRAEILDRIEQIGAVVERRDIDGFDLEVFPDRPDLFSVEGIARAMRAFMGLEPGLKRYEVAPPQVELHVDPSVLDVRPVIACAVVRNIIFDDDSIASLMDFQEKLHLTVGRKRKKVSIGVHDMRYLVSPYTYKGADPSTRFEPLQGDREMDMDEILTEHPKGVDYAWILEGKERYPLIVDAEDQVLSFPPIINGTVTQVREDTSDLFLDVTGLDEAACKYSLRILATMLAERGGRIEAVKVVHPDGVVLMPDLEPTPRQVKLAEILPWTGLELTAEEAARALQIMGFDASVSEDGEHLDLLVPAWRMDILHDVDIAEDVAIGFGYERIKGVLPEVHTIGHDLPDEDIKRMAHVAFQGRGFTEVMHFVLTSDEEQYELMGIEAPPDATRIINPITEHYTMVRTHLLPDLLAYLGRNTHHDYPQEAYEVGHVVRGGQNKLRTAAVSCHARAGFTAVKSLTEGVLRDLG
ncbi:MAG: phenylalanine--tRNA ligase subunit beta, partial [Thermoplasmata archaeon]|nr:phenylalanine--tRNA ligase subunit beta [Thermoplasmata archaeon]NIS11576.1 phenylalanine--tRNA ligase subunit beta [Thermoplasmata archaeon]NIS19491.1 phenylalanine--tRNA ligase subunit beta [Thermoplasmata archaeon]NIT76622.1 phenylalanine--tRNA ligase subunit beta [Thermoplasmata archaeon]NIU48607.1 phenylalanine--tRNA ligase subunit beta [Thermoplasmata archaeon]